MDVLVWNLFSPPDVTTTDSVVLRAMSGSYRNKVVIEKNIGILQEYNVRETFKEKNNQWGEPVLAGVPLPVDSKSWLLISVFLEKLQKPQTRQLPPSPCDSFSRIDSVSYTTYFKSWYQSQCGADEPKDFIKCFKHSMFVTWVLVSSLFQSKVPAEWRTSGWQTQTVGDFELPGQGSPRQPGTGWHGDKETVRLKSFNHFLSLSFWMVYLSYTSWTFKSVWSHDPFFSKSSCLWSWISSLYLLACSQFSMCVISSCFPQQVWSSPVFWGQKPRPSRSTACSPMRGWSSAWQRLWISALERWSLCPLALTPTAGRCWGFASWRSRLRGSALCGPSPPGRRAIRSPGAVTVVSKDGLL